MTRLACEARPLPRRPLRHRRALERAGWRTWLEYSENLIRNGDGVLVSVEPRWTAEAEHADKHMLVASATAPTVVEAFAQLRATIAASAVGRTVC